MKIKVERIDIADYSAPDVDDEVFVWTLFFGDEQVFDDDGDHFFYLDEVFRVIVDRLSEGEYELEIETM